MKGVILAAGKGTRLYPATLAMSKPLLPVYDRPMVYYPMAMLIDLGIRDILIISSEEDIDSYRRLFGDGSRLGIHIEYAVQYVQRGIADAFIVGREFIGGDSVCLALGDNIFLGEDFFSTLEHLTPPEEGALIFGYPVEDPTPFGVVEFDDAFNVLSLEEKPQEPKSNYIVPGLYFYDNDVVSIAAGLEPSARGELEITDVNRVYLERGRLKVQLIGETTEWFDAGSARGLLAAANAAEEVQRERGVLFAAEEMAYRRGFINRETLAEIARSMKKTDYGQYLMKLAEGSKA